MNGPVAAVRAIARIRRFGTGCHTDDPAVTLTLAQVGSVENVALRAGVAAALNARASDAGEKTTEADVAVEAAAVDWASFRPIEEDSAAAAVRTQRATRWPEETRRRRRVLQAGGGDRGDSDSDDAHVSARADSDSDSDSDSLESTWVGAGMLPPCLAECDATLLAALDEVESFEQLCAAVAPLLATGCVDACRGTAIKKLRTRIVRVWHGGTETGL
jgi:hypothetical protein